MSVQRVVAGGPDGEVEGRDPRARRGGIGGRRAFSSQGPVTSRPICAFDPQGSVFATVVFDESVVTRTCTVNAKPVRTDEGAERSSQHVVPSDDSQFVDGVAALATPASGSRPASNMAVTAALSARRGMGCLGICLPPRVRLAVRLMPTPAMAATTDLFGESRPREASCTRATDATSGYALCREESSPDPCIRGSSTG